MRPYNDTTMTYDRVAHRYVLTKQYCLEHNVDLDAELNTYGMINRAGASAHFLDRISAVIYAHCYSHGNKYGKERDMATKEQYRDVIRDAMFEQVMYTMANGDLHLSVRPDGIRRPIAPYAHDLLANAGLCHAGLDKYGNRPNYDEEGY